MIEWMAKFKIGSRIFTGFALVLILLCGLAFTGWYSLTGASTRSEDYARFSHQVNDILDIQAQISDLRRIVRIYGFTGEEKAFIQTKDVLGKLQQSLKDAQQVYRNETHRDAMSRAIMLAANYADGIEALKTARKSRDESENAMRLAGAGAINKLEKVQEMYNSLHDVEGTLAISDIQTEAALARLAALNYIYLVTPAAQDAAAQKLAALRASLEGLTIKAKTPQAQALLRETTLAVGGYEASFANLTKMVEAANAQLNVALPKVAADFSAITDGLSQDLQNAMKKLDEETRSANDTAIRLLITVAVIALGLGVLFALLIARGITIPVNNMTQAMTTLAGGDNTVAIPALNSHDEIGDMAKAVQVFKQNAIDKLRMEAEQRAAEEATRLAEEEQRKREAAIVAEVAEVAKAASTGDLDRRIDLEGKSGFLLNLCEGVNNLVHLTGVALKDVASVLSAVAQGDLTKRITGDYAGVFGQLKGDVNLTADKLFEVVSNINEASTQITGAASEVAAGSQDLSERSEQQASALEETAASMEELAATVRQNSANAQQANQLAAGAREVASGGGQVVNDAITAMGRIEGSSQKIEDIVGMIDEIAFQTNLLALNAAVEAARAGDAGKGFAVVAQEVRNLAQRSAQASKEIKTLIAESSSQVRSGADLVKGAGKTLEEILGSVKRVADIVAEIAAASAEQASGIDQVNQAVTQMDEMTQQNAALVEESTAAAHALEEQARHLGEVMAFFHTGEEAKPAPVAASRQAAKPAAKPAPKKPLAGSHPAKPAQAKKPAASAKAKADDEDWAEF